MNLSSTYEQFATVRRSAPELTCDTQVIRALGQRENLYYPHKWLMHVSALSGFRNHGNAGPDGRFFNTLPRAFT